MAAKRPKSDDEVAEVGLVADVDDDEEELPEGFGVATDGEDEPDEEDLEDDEDDEEDDVADVVDLVEAEEDEDVVPDVVAAVLGTVPDVAEESPVVGVLEDDDGEEVEGIRPGIDFVCTRCHLVKRNSQLHKRSPKDAPVCRSCA